MYIICTYLLPTGNASVGDDDDFALLVKGHDLRHTVGVTGVVDVPGRSPGHRGIHDRLVIDPEHVHPSVL